MTRDELRDQIAAAVESNLGATAGISGAAHAHTTQLMGAIDAYVAEKLSEDWGSFVPQRCENGKHPDWAVDAEDDYTYRCPWCALEEQREEFDEVLDMHRPYSGDFSDTEDACNHDGFNWPCPTYLAAGGVVEQKEAKT